jgi:hypothetical protein
LLAAAAAAAGEPATTESPSGNSLVEVEVVGDGWDLVIRGAVLFMVVAVDGAEVSTSLFLVSTNDGGGDLRDSDLTSPE